MNESTITLPLYQGHIRGGGEAVWYILTDTTDKGNAEALGLNWSPKLANSAPGARVATLLPNATLEFHAGTVDFGPEHRVTPCSGDPSNPFPPSEAQPGSIGCLILTSVLLDPVGTFLDSWHSVALWIQNDQMLLPRLCRCLQAVLLQD
ncbi:MAG TPA: hypothetical protein VFZ67_11460 [Nitrososphaera sp.]|jgi:hypothetical protein